MPPALRPPPIREVKPLLIFKVAKIVNKGIRGVKALPIDTIESATAIRDFANI